MSCAIELLNEVTLYTDMIFLHSQRRVHYIYSYISILAPYIIGLCEFVQVRLW